MTIYDDLISSVCAAFQVPPPTVVFNARRYNACYYIRRQEIRISREYGPDERKAALVHELAHHVDHMDRRAQGIERSKGRRNHDRIYFEWLTQVIRMAYARIEDYPWHREYRTLYWWACQQGYAMWGLNWYGDPRPTLSSRHAEFLTQRRKEAV
jgi:predicted SprT family Zn-dependent metalloprotease